MTPPASFKENEVTFRSSWQGYVTSKSLIVFLKENEVTFDFGAL